MVKVDVERIKCLRSQGLSYREIGKTLGVSVNTVQKYCGDVVDKKFEDLKKEHDKHVLVVEEKHRSLMDCMVKNYEERIRVLKKDFENKEKVLIDKLRVKDLECEYKINAVKKFIPVKKPVVKLVIPAVNDKDESSDVKDVEVISDVFKFIVGMGFILLIVVGGLYVFLRFFNLL